MSCLIIISAKADFLFAYHIILAAFLNVNQILLNDLKHHQYKLRTLYSPSLQTFWLLLRCVPEGTKSHENNNDKMRKENNNELMKMRCRRMKKKNETENNM